MLVKILVGTVVYVLDVFYILPMHESSLPNTIRQKTGDKLYLDFDSFFATAEQHFNAELCGKPVGVVPLDTPHTGCIAISREAKTLGVPSGATIKVAREICPSMVIVVARPDAYVRLHKRIIAVIEECLPIAKVRSIDEVVCHLLPSEAANGALLAQQIKDALAENFSSVLTCSIGIAKTEMLAKIGAEMNKPDGFTLLRPSDLPGVLCKLKLNDLPGISKGIEARLAAANIRDISALWEIGPKHARALWGNVEGERFWNSLHGYHVERPQTTKRMFGHSRMLPLDWRSPQKVRDCARQLTMSAARRLRRAGVQASKLTMGLRGGGYRDNRGSRKDDRRWNYETAFLPARDDQTLLAALSNAFDRALVEVQFRPRSVSVMLHGLITNDQIQLDLFGAQTEVVNTSDRADAKVKREKLSEAMDQIRAVHGPSGASFGMNKDIPGGYLGAKIAFGRIPDADDFSEAPTKDGETHFLSY